MNLSIEQLDRQARLQYLQGRLKQLKEVVPNLAALDVAAADFSSAQAALALAKAALERKELEAALIQSKEEIQKHQKQ
jgi:hypothetical protein